MNDLDYDISYITFETINTEEPHETLSSRSIKRSDIAACRFFIMVPEHYREDGSCKCDDKEEREKMIKAWEYTRKDFKGIPLRT